MRRVKASPFSRVPKRGDRSFLVLHGLGTHVFRKPSQGHGGFKFLGVTGQVSPVSGVPPSKVQGVFLVQDIPVGHEVQIDGIAT